MRQYLNDVDKKPRQNRLPQGQEPPNTGGACFAMSARDKRWVENAINAELRNIEQLSSGDSAESLTKPHSKIGLSLLKIASIVKGYNLSPQHYYTQILFALRSHPISSKPKHIHYQWGRMLKRAQPRRRVQR